MFWYVLHIKPRREKIAILNLQRLGVEAFSPFIKNSKATYRGRETAPQPFFPGYIFCKFDLRLQYRMVNYSSGVVRVVRFGSTLAYVEEEIIESIKERTENGLVKLNPSSITMGQVVRIQEGPLKGFEAVFESYLKDSDRVAVLLRNVSYQTRVIMDVGNIDAGAPLSEEKRGFNEISHELTTI